MHKMVCYLFQYLALCINFVLSVRICYMVCYAEVLCCGVMTRK